MRYGYEVCVTLEAIDPSSIDKPRKWPLKLLMMRGALEGLISLCEYCEVAAGRSPQLHRLSEDSVGQTRASPSQLIQTVVDLGARSPQSTSTASQHSAQNWELRVSCRSCWATVVFKTLSRGGRCQLDADGCQAGPAEPLRPGPARLSK